MELRFRAAGVGDHAFLYDLTRECFRDVVTRQFGAWDDEDQRRRFAASVGTSAYSVVYAVDDAVGAIWCSEEPDCLRLCSIMVRPQFQGRGIGSELLAREIAAARVARKPLRLRVLLQNRAFQLYLRHGFIVTHRDETHTYMERAGDGPS